MPHIFVKNVGPIAEAKVEFRKCTIFVGEQGAGKSTIAKLCSLFTWLEKGLLRHMLSLDAITKNNRFKNKYAAYHNLDSYMSASSYIMYDGDFFVFTYENEHLFIEKKQAKQEEYVAKVMYVPAERNLLSVIESSKLQSGLSAAMQTLMEEFNNAKISFAKGLDLPIDNLTFSYDRLNKVSWINGVANDGAPYKVMLKEAASGFQSLLPLIIVSHYLSDLVIKRELGAVDYNEQKFLQQEVDKIMANGSLSESVKNAVLRNLSSRFKYSSFVNIVEELEQNLYPQSQKKVLLDLLQINAAINANRLVLTTHSPYLINYMTLIVKASMLNDKITDKALQKSLYSIVPACSMLKSEDLAIYELKGGKACLLDNYDGLPSDANFLNQQMIETNELFDELLDIEEQIK